VLQLLPNGAAASGQFQADPLFCQEVFQQVTRKNTLFVEKFKRSDPPQSGQKGSRKPGIEQQKKQPQSIDPPPGFLSLIFRPYSPETNTREYQQQNSKGTDTDYFFVHKTPFLSLFVFLFKIVPSRKKGARKKFPSSHFFIGFF
jgi:hypothetical protein